MRYYWDLIQHFFVSNSRHGTHSPFVYGLASRVIYRNAPVRPYTVAVPSDFNPKYSDLLLAILTDMGVQKLACFREDTSADALFADLRSARADQLLEAILQGKIIVVHEPFQTRQTKQLWRELIQSPEVVVSINLFHFGLLMYREGQRKENFLLRYPFWR